MWFLIFNDFALNACFYKQYLLISGFSFFPNVVVSVSADENLDWSTFFLQVLWLKGLADRTQTGLPSLLLPLPHYHIICFHPVWGFFLKYLLLSWVCFFCGYVCGISGVWVSGFWFCFFFVMSAFIFFCSFL